MTRFTAVVGAAMLASGLGAAAGTADVETERSQVEQWRAARVAELTGDEGWLNLVGLFWLDEGENTFGRDPSNRLVLDHPGLAPFAGSFVRAAGGIHFTARAHSGITHEGLRSGTYGRHSGCADRARQRLFAVLHHRAGGKNGGAGPRPGQPAATPFHTRLDAVLESPGDQTLFVMFADGTSGHESYGGGRFMRVPLPRAAVVRVDFNESYNPPCAFNDFATCPLPPYQNRLTLRVEAGEKTYASGHGPPAPAKR